MKPEYEKICSDIDTELASERLSLSARAAVRMAVTKCAALAAKPRELTDAEVEEIWLLTAQNCVRLVVAKADEIRARPAEPETVPFSFANWSNGEWQAMEHRGECTDDVESLRPGFRYSMRRKP